MTLSKLDKPSPYTKDNAVYKIVKQIPKGKVATYGQVAKLAGLNSPRLVGRILHYNPSEATIPCHRVVRSNGAIGDVFAFGGQSGKIKRLESEGVSVHNNKVDLAHYLWHPE